MRAPIFRSGLHNIILAIAVILIGYSMFAAVYFFRIEVGGVVVGRSEICSQPLKNRCDNFLLIQTPNGELIRWLPVSGFFDFNLISIGMKIEKKSFSYKYEIDGKPYYFKSYRLFLGSALFGAVLLPLWSSPRFRVFTDHVLKKNLHCSKKKGRP